MAAAHLTAPEIRDGTPEDWIWARSVWPVPALTPGCGTCLLVATVDGERVGYLAWDWGGGGAVDMVYVDLAHRRRGIATALHGAASAAAGRRLSHYNFSPAGRALFDTLHANRP